MSVPNEQPLLGEDEKISTLEASGEKPEQKKLMFFLLGNSSLLAFNIIINAIDIYIEATKRPNIGTELNRAYNVPCSIMAFILCIFKPSNYKYSLIIGLGGLAVIMCLLPVFLLVHISPDAMYWLTIITIGLIGVLSSLVFSSANSFASQFGSGASAAVSSGNGCCGVIAAVLRIITKACVKANDSKAEKYASAAYFFIAALIFVLTLVYFFTQLSNPLVSSRIKSEPTQEKQPIFSKSVFGVIKVIWVQWLSVFINFCITLSIFPGYLIGVKSVSYLGSWTPVIITTLFCVFDWVGRIIPSYFVWPVRKFAWIPVAARLLFYLIFMISIQRVANLGDPWWTFAWMIPFAISNGMAGTVQVIYGANHDELTFEQRKYAGLMVSFAVNAGILAAMGLTTVIPTPPSN